MHDRDAELAGADQAAGVDPASDEPRFRQILRGDRLPSMSQACGERPRFAFDAVAGRYQLYGFFLSLDLPQIRSGLEAIAGRRDLFNDVHCAFTGVSVVPADRERGGLRNLEPGIRFAWDHDHQMSRACGALSLASALDGPTPARRCWILVDPSLHVLRVFPMAGTDVEEVIAAVAALPPPDQFGGVSRPAPILMLPHVFEPELCQRLIALYEAEGGAESGVHRDGQPVIDAAFKRRKDYTIEDPGLLQDLKWRVARRVLPEIEKLFFMRARWIERHIIGCYSAEDGGHFSPHTDNGPGLTAHRRFAVSVNLSGGFEGGEVVFPEYNMQGYKAPPGWAIVFPCAVLHAVRRVTRGVRYAYLPFVYDEAGHVIREAELARAAEAEGRPIET